MFMEDILNLKTGDKIRIIFKHGSETDLKIKNITKKDNGLILFLIQENGFAKYNLEFNNFLSYLKQNIYFDWIELLSKSKKEQLEFDFN